MPRPEDDLLEAWQTARSLPRGNERRDATDVMLGLGGLSLGGMTGAFINAWPKDEFNLRQFQELVNRADYINSNPERFKTADPQLRRAYTNLGVSGLDHAASEVWGRHVGVGTDWEPADISKAGQFDPRGQKTILTVTPEPNASRFNSPMADGTSVAGGVSGTGWGNDKYPQTGYAEGNLNVKRVAASNPSTHFSVVDLPAADETGYMTTSEASRAAEAGKKRGWGRATHGDMHFGKEYVQGRGVTTANDVYTWLRQKGHKTPQLVKGDGPGNLDRLIDSLAEATGEYNAYKNLEDLASPNPTWGAPERVTGQLPTLEEMNFAAATPEQRAAAGYGSFYEPGGNRPVRADNLPVPVDQRMSIPKDLIDVDVDTPNLRPGVTAASRRLVGNGISGLTTAALLSPQVIQQLEDGNVAGAVGTTALSYGGGEVAGKVGNKVVEELTKKGVTQAPAMAIRLGRAAATGGAIELAAMAERSTPKVDVRELPPENPIRQHVERQTPTKAGKLGPDNAFADVPVKEQVRIRQLPARTQQVKAMPVGNQVIYNANNELRYAGEELTKGRVPYLGWKLPWAK